MVPISVLETDDLEWTYLRRAIPIRALSVVDYSIDGDRSASIHSNIDRNAIPLGRPYVDNVEILAAQYGEPRVDVARQLALVQGGALVASLLSAIALRLAGYRLFSNNR